MFNSTWILLFSTLALFSTEQLATTREDGSELIAFCDQPTEASYPIVFLIAGSQKETSEKLHNILKNDLLSKGLCPVTIEKRGLEGREFDLYLPIHERLKDQLLLHKNLKLLLPNWNGKLAILGQGDGGRVGALFAAEIKGVAGIALIASGGGWAPLDETLYSFRSEMADDGFSPQYIHGFLVQARQEFSKALETPKADLKAFGYSYKYWESLSKTHLGKELSKLSCPIYSINGALDNRIPIESVDQLAKALKDRMILIRKEKAGREILQDPKIYKEAISWLSENF